MLGGEVRDEELYVATKINVAELLLSGCTTAVDHNYLRATPDLHQDTQIQASHEMGIRYHHARGSNSQGFDPIVEKEEDVLADTTRLIKTYHDPKPGAMLRIENAPGAPFSMSARFFQKRIALARGYGVGNHTHLA